MISTFSCFLRSIYWWYSSPFSSTNNCISGFATKTKILSEMALTIKSSALTGRTVPFFISSCSDRSSRLIANRKLGNKVLRQISFPHSLVRISLYINKGSSGLAVKRSKCASMKHFIFSKKGNDSSTRERNVSASCLAFSSNTLLNRFSFVRK